MSWPSFSAFMRDCTVQDSVLVTPVRYLWKAYLAYCAEWGFQPAEASEFMSWLSFTEGVTIKNGGSGKLRRAAEGIALRVDEQQMNGEASCI